MSIEEERVNAAEEQISKFADAYVNAGTIDSGSKTVDMVFAEAMIIAQPRNALEESGVVQVKHVGANTDKCTFTAIPRSTFTWTTVDARGSEDHAIKDSQTITSPVFTQVQPTTKSATIFFADNADLVNPVTFKEIALLAGNAIREKKTLDAIAELTTLANYTAGTSIRNAGGFTAKGAVAADDTLSPNDLNSCVKDLKNKTTPVFANVALMHTNQKDQVENHANFSPGQTTNANFKKAKFDIEGTLVKFGGLHIVELLEHEMPIMSTGAGDDFNVVAGHYVIVGRKDLMVGRGEHNARNKVEDFRNPQEHGIRRTLDVNYEHVLKYPDGVRVLQCAQ